MVIDLPLVWLCYALALAARGTTADVEYEPALWFALLASAVVVACNQAFGIYRRWWRYATSQDLVPLILAVSCATVLVVGADLAWPARPMPLSTIFLGGFFALCAMTAVRYRAKPLIAVRKAWRRLVTAPQAHTRVLIVGAGDAGQLLGWQLQYGPAAEGHHVVGFVDDDRRKHGMLIHGRAVLGDRAAIPRLVVAHDVDLIVIAIHRVSGRDFRDIVGTCQETTAQIKVLPNVYDAIRDDRRRIGVEDAVRPDAIAPGGTSGSLFGDVTLEDLLGRHSVQIDREQCRDLVRAKSVLVTGASGSIGAELCRQLADLRPGRLLMLDTNESGLHDLSVELQGYRSDDTALVPIVGDVTHEPRMRDVFARERPAVVFHAAAYKHVPLMEEYPEEAVRVNVGGTCLAAALAAEYGAERFVLVSSDKAVEPSSVMGATKRVCELLTATMSPGSTLYTAVRFGNVLVSRGSVVPTFSKQIDMGGPVTITDPSMSRYFMSISEASGLVIQAATYTEGSDLFILDMGEEISIVDLARRMIRLRGLRPDVDIPIVVTGRRPGEKLREVLHSADERTRETPHPQVLRVQGGRSPARAELARAISELLAAARAGDRDAVWHRLWSVAAGGVTPARTPIAAYAGVGALAGSAAGGRTAGQTAALRPSLGAGPSGEPTGSGFPRSASIGGSPPLRVAADRVGAGLVDLADRGLGLEPFYAVPAVAVLLAYPNPLVGPALALALLPWLLRWIRTGRPTAATPFDVPLALLLVGGVVGVLATTDDLWAGIRLSGLVAGLALFFLIVNQATSVHRLAIALMLTIGVAVVGSLALLILTGPYLPIGALAGPWDGLFAAIEGLRQAALGPDEALQRYRFRASGVGALATFGMALAVGPIVAAVRPKTRLIGYGLLVFFGAILLLSGNRGSLVSAVALGAALLGLRSGWLVAAVPLVLIGLWAALERGLFGPAAADAQPLAVKVGFWQNAALMLHDFAWTGAGLGLRSVRDVYEAYFLSVGPGFSHAHNIFIQAYLEQGLLGCVGLVSLAAALLFYARRAAANARGPLAWGTALSAGGAATALFFEGLTEIVPLTSLGTVMLLVALGLLVAAARLNPRADQTEGAPRWPSARLPRSRVATPLLATLPLLLAGALLFTPLGASLYLNLGAVERARAELSADTTREEREGRLARAESLLRRGLAIDDRDPALWRNLAEVALARGDAPAARSLLRQARERTGAGDAYGLFQLGRLYREGGFWREATRAWHDAGANEALQSWAGDLRARNQWERLAGVYDELGRPEDAAAARREAAGSAR